MASDGKWYAPELWTGPPLTGPTPPQSAPTASPGSVYPGQATPYPGQADPYAGQSVAYPVQSPGPAGTPYGYPAQPYGQYPAQPFGQYAPYGMPRRNNGLAVASLVCACVGLFLLPAIVAVIFGFVSRAQIRQSAGTQGGDGLALAGIIVGFAWIAFFVIVAAVGAANSNTNGVVGLVAGLNA
jgi:hypothetical protein